MIQIFADKFTKRFEYSVRFVFFTILHQEVRMMRAQNEFDASYPSLYYGDSYCADSHAFKVCPSGLLSERGVGASLRPGLCSFDGVPALFPVSDGDLPFDIFSAVFYMITRYEEYGIEGFSCHDSLQYREGFVEQPVVDLWALSLDKFLSSFDSRYVSCFRPSFSFVSVINIDEPYKYRHRGLVFTTRTLARKLFSGMYSRFHKQIMVLLHFRDDPYDNVERIIESHATSNVVPMFFMRMKHGPQGRLANYRRMLYRSFLVGLIPTSSGSLTVQGERAKLEKRIVHSRVVLSRFGTGHFSVPESLRTADALGFTDDYSMGFARHIGYRAGTAHPFRFYDVEKDLVGNLRVHPVVITDEALYNMQSRREDLSKIFLLYAENVKSVGGELVSGFSNVSLSNNGRWGGWSAGFFKAIESVARLEKK